LAIMLNSFEKSILNHRINDNGVIERRCTGCQKWLEENFDNFYCVNKKAINKKYTPECKECAKKRTDDNRSEKYDDYYRDYNKQLYLKDPQKFIESDRKHRLLNPEAHKLKDKKWREKHPEKCIEHAKKHRNHEITPEEWRSCLKIFGNKCAYCGLPAKKHIVTRNGKDIIMNFHKEHVDDDGYNDLRNAVPSCQSCNSSKHESSLNGWYKSRDFYNEKKYNKIIWWTTEGYKTYIEEKPPYRIIRKQNEGKKNFHWEMWSVDEKRNMIECIKVGDKRKDLLNT